MTNAPRRTRIKICGITTPEAAEIAIAAGADAVGLVFAEGSPRRVTLETARGILDAVRPALVSVVGVHRDPDPARAEAMFRLGDAVQLHGDEDESAVAAVAARGTSRLIRGFPFDPEQVRRWDANPHVAALLIDGPRGGSGEAFDHAALAAMMERGEIAKPVILAGGLTPATVGEAIRVVRPYAVDVSSGVEGEPGVKDPDRIVAFSEAVREADSSGFARG